MIGRFPFMRLNCKFSFQNIFSLSNGVSHFVPKNCSSTDKWLRMLTNTVSESGILLTKENQIDVGTVSEA